MGDLFTVSFCSPNKKDTRRVSFFVILRVVEAKTAKVGHEAVLFGVFFKRAGDMLLVVIELDDTLEAVVIEKPLFGLDLAVPPKAGAAYGIAEEAKQNVDVMAAVAEELTAANTCRGRTVCGVALIKIEAGQLTDKSFLFLKK